MKIVVCVKQVPDTETRIRIAPDGKAIAEADVNWIVSPYDEFAIEEALRIKEAKGGEVVLRRLGPDRAQSALRNGLAMGADSAVHLKDPLFDEPTRWARPGPWPRRSVRSPSDLVLTGQQGVGGDNSQIPGLLAEILDLPQVTMAVKLEIGEGKATVEREIEGAHEVVGDRAARRRSRRRRASTSRATRASRASWRPRRRRSRRKTRPRSASSREDLAPKTRVVALELPPARAGREDDRRRRRRPGKELLRLLHEEAKVI